MPISRGAENLSGVGKGSRGETDQTSTSTRLLSTKRELVDLPRPNVLSTAVLEKLRNKTQHLEGAEGRNKVKKTLKLTRNEQDSNPTSVFLHQLALKQSFLCSFQ